MAFSTKQKLIDQKYQQPVGGVLTLSGDTYVATSGDLRFSEHPTFTDDEQVVDKKYVDDLVQSGTTSSTTYDLSSPSTITVGGLGAGSDLLGLTSNEILEDILVPYLNPAFTAFNINGQGTTIEVGTPLSGNKLFAWSISNSGNVATNSLDIRDVTAASNIATGLANDGSQLVDIGVITNTAPISQQWRGEANNTEAGSFQSSNFTVNSIYPYFWGKVASGGAEPGSNRPTANQTLIDSGTKVVSSSTGTITIDFNTTSDDYLWFAIPTISTSKSVWYVTALNNGSIGGAVSPGGNLFPNFDNVNINDPSVNWNGIDYKIYISNFQSALSAPMQLRNS